MLVARREGTRRLPPTEIYETILRYNSRTATHVIAFATRQLATADKSWVAWCIRSGDRKIPDIVSTTWRMSDASETLHKSAMTHMHYLQAGASAPCICEGRAVPGWEQILSVNNVEPARYWRALWATFRGGGGKGLNHLYIGAPNSGKTA